MSSRVAPAVCRQDHGVRAPVLTGLARRIAAGRADTSLHRDPDFIRTLLPAIAR